MKELWKPIECADAAYEVSNLGRVRSWYVYGSNSGKKALEPRILKPDISWCGYYRIALYKNGTSFKKQLSRIVLEAFSGQPPHSFEAAHLNGIKADNRFQNLKWCSKKENAYHKKLHGTQIAGETHHLSKLTNMARFFIVEKTKEGWFEREIAEYLGIKRSNVQTIKRSMGVALKWEYGAKLRNKKSFS